MKNVGILGLLLFGLAASVFGQTPPGAYTSPSGAGGGITQVSSLPGTCSVGQQFQITGTTNTFGCGPSANQFFPMGNGAGNGASPAVRQYFGPNCPTSNTASCFFTTANVQINNTCEFSNASTTLQCFTLIVALSASVTSNVATVVTGGNPLSLGWHSGGGDTVVVVGFSGGDTIWNGTFTTTAATSNSISYALVHANASSSTGPGSITNQSVGPFTSADATKLLWGYDSAVASSATSCDPYQPQPQPDFITTTHVTIQTFTDSVHVVLSATPSTSSAGVKHACIMWGTSDDANAAILEAAIQTLASCPRVTMSGGNYLFTTFHFTQNPLGCANLPTQYPNSNFGLAGTGGAGNNFLYSGFELEGAGRGATVWFQPPDFPETGSCNNSGIGICWAVPPMAYFHDFSITSGSGRNGMPVGDTLISVGQLGAGMLANFGANGIEDNNVSDNSHCIKVLFQGQLQDIETNACGTQSIDWDPTTGTFGAENAWSYRVSSDNAIYADFFVEAGARLSLHSCFGFGTQQASGANGVVNRGGFIELEDCNLGQFALGAGGTPSGSFGYNCQSLATQNCIAYFKNVRFPGFGSATNATSINCGHAGDIYLFDTELFSNGTGKTYQDVAGCRLFDQGGNQGNGVNGLGATAALTVVGSIIGTASTPATTSAATNFGATLATQTVNQTAPTGPVTLNVNLVQSLLGVGCTVASNTVTPTVNWTGPGGTAESSALTALSISGVGVLDSFQNDTLTISAKTGTAITFTTASALASTGCTTTPQYTVYAKVAQ